MLKKTASGVLARLDPQRTQRVRLRSSLSAALLDSLFEHPAGLFPHCAAYKDYRNPYWSHQAPRRR